jgi:hypothetical protein
VGIKTYESVHIGLILLAIACVACSRVIAVREPTTFVRLRPVFDPDDDQPDWIVGIEVQYDDLPETRRP